MLGGSTCECYAPIRRDDHRPPQKVAGLKQPVCNASVVLNLTAPASAGCLGRADSDLISIVGNPVRRRFGYALVMMSRLIKRHGLCGWLIVAVLFMQIATSASS